MAQANDHCIKDLDEMYSTELKRWDMFASAPGPPPHLLYSPPHTSKSYQARPPSHLYNNTPPYTKPRTPHTDDEPSQLKICSQNSPQQAASSDREKKAFRCDQCGFSFKFQCHLTAHLLQHTGEKPFKCTQCPFASTQKGHLKNHMLKHTGEMPFGCDECDYRARRKDILDQHKMSHTGERPYSCAQCDCRFKRAYGLKKHMLTHVKNESVQQLRCGECNYWAKTQEILDVHKMCHTVEKPLVCDQCGFRFRRLRDLNRHKLTHSDEKPFACDHCDVRTKRASDLKKHKLSYHTEINCPSCPFVAIGKKDLKCHEKSDHTLGKMWTCDTCSFSSANRSYLKRHKATMKCHPLKTTPEVPDLQPRLQSFPCNECLEVFSTMKDLNFHKMIHTLQLLPRTFPCDQCHEIFAVEEDLGYHKIRRHVYPGTLVYECNTCAFCSLDQGSLSQHKMRCGGTSNMLTDLLMCQGGQH